MSKIKTSELKKIQYEGQLVQAAQSVMDRLLACVTHCRPVMQSYLGNESVRSCMAATRAFTNMSSSLLYDHPSPRYTTKAAMKDFRARGERMVIDLMQDDLVERVVMHERPRVGATMLTAVVCLLEQEGVGRDEAVGRVLDSILLVLGKTDYLADFMLNYLNYQQTYNDEVTIYTTLLSALTGDFDESEPCPS